MAAALKEWGRVPVPTRRRASTTDERPAIQRRWTTPRSQRLAFAVGLHDVRSIPPRSAATSHARFATDVITEYLEIRHDRRRRHSTLGRRSPMEFEDQSKIVVA